MKRRDAIPDGERDESDFQISQTTGQVQRRRKRSPISSLWVALSLYSTLPVPQRSLQRANLRHALVWFPLVGLIVGGVWLGWHQLGILLKMQPLVFAVLALILNLLITGAIHVDGLCDAADGLFSSRPAAEQLAIMRDVQIGTFGVLTLVVTLMLQFASLTWLATASWRFWLAVLSALILERALSGFLVVTLPKAKPDGMAVMVAEAADRDSRLILLVEAAVAAVILLLSVPRAGSICLVLVLLWTFLFSRLLKKRFGGITGDLAGFYLVMAETIQLASLVIVGGVWR